MLMARNSQSLSSASSIVQRVRALFPLAAYAVPTNISAIEALKQLLILERTPEPDVGSPAPELSSLNPKQRKEVKRYIDRLQISQSSSDVKVKRERDEEGNASTARPSKRKPGKSITIDLTNDSDGH